MPLGDKVFGQDTNSLRRLQDQYKGYQDGIQGLENHKVYQKRQQGWGTNLYQGMGHGILNAAESTANLIPDILGEEDRYFRFADSMPENTESGLSTFTSDIFQFGTGLLMGGPIKKVGQGVIRAGAKKFNKKLRDKMSPELARKLARKEAKRGAITPKKFWEITREGALTGGIAEFIAFRGQDEGLILSRFFETYPEMADHFEEATDNPRWMYEPPAVVANRMQQSWAARAGHNMGGRAAFALEGALIGAVFNHVVNLAGVAWTKAAGKDPRTLKAAEGADPKGASKADSQEVAANKKKEADGLEKETVEDLAFKRSAVEKSREALAEAHQNAADEAGNLSKPAREALKDNPKEAYLDDPVDNGELMSGTPDAPNPNFTHAPHQTGKPLDVEYFSEAPKGHIPVDLVRAVDLTTKWAVKVSRGDLADSAGKRLELETAGKDVSDYLFGNPDSTLGKADAEAFLDKHNIAKEEIEAFQQIKEAFNDFGFDDAELQQLGRVAEDATEPALFGFLRAVGKAVNNKDVVDSGGLVDELEQAARKHIFDNVDEEQFYGDVRGDVLSGKTDIDDAGRVDGTLGRDAKWPDLNDRGNAFMRNLSDIADKLVDGTKVNPKRFDTPESLSKSYNEGNFHKDSKALIMVSRINAQKFWDGWGDKQMFGTGDQSLPKDVFNDYDEFEAFLVEHELAKLQFPKKGGEKQIFDRAVRSAKRKGIGNFFKYEFGAPKGLKHLELTPDQQARVLMDDSVYPRNHDLAGQVKPEKVKELKDLTAKLSGKTPTGESMHTIWEQAIKLLRPDTAFSDVGMKYFSGRVFSFFYKNLSKSIGQINDADTFAKAVEMQGKPTGLKEALEEHFLNNTQDFAESMQMDTITMGHRIAKGRGDFIHNYSDIKSHDQSAFNAEMDVATMKEMNVRIMAYRLEQAVGMKSFKALTEEIDRLPPAELAKMPKKVSQYMFELEKQEQRIGRMQKLRQASGRILRAWHSFVGGAGDFSADQMESLGTKTKNMGSDIEGIKRHAARVNAIFKGADGKSMDTAAAASDYLGKSSKWIDVHNEYWINSILSGTKTQMVNLLSTGVHMYFKPLEAVMGTLAPFQTLSAEQKLARKQLTSVLVNTAMINLQAVRAMGVLGLQNLRHLGGALDNKAFQDKRAALYTKGQGEGTYAQGIQSLAGAKKSWRSGRGTLSEGADLFDVSPPHTISAHKLLSDAASEKASKTLDWVGNFIRIPSRFMIGTDELFKQISYRANVMGRLAGEAVEKELKGKDMVEYIADGFSGMIRESGRRHTKQAIRDEGFRKYQQIAKDETSAELRKFRNKEDFVDDYMDRKFDKNKSELSQLGMDWAEDVTFTRGLDKDLLDLQAAGVASKNRTSWMKDMQDTVHRHPWMRLIMPFIRTPVNILKFPLQRTPWVMSSNGKMMGFEAQWLKDLHLRYQADMVSGDAIKAAEATGRVYAGNFYWMSLMSLAGSGIVTGGGPSNPRERANLMATGWRPYSFHLGDYYISYARFDPFSSVIGLSADVYEKFTDLGRDGDVEDNWATSIMMAGAYSISNNIADKSYLAGINNVIGALIDPEHKMKSLMKKQLTSYIPKAISQWTPLTDDAYMKKTYGMMDAVMNRIPGLAEGVEPLRNYLGEPLMAMYAPTVWAAGFNPFLISKDANDPILNELASLGYGFGAPTPRLNGVRHLDMRKFYDGKGRTAFDFFQAAVGTVKVRGLNIREMLTRLFDSEVYKTSSMMASKDLLQFPGHHRDPRVKYIKSVMGEFRDAARKLTKKEHPELRKAYNAFKQTERREKLAIHGLDQA
jgi:hypothetical protein